MRKAYSVLERQQMLVRHLQEKVLQETDPVALTSASKQLVHAIQGLLMCTSSSDMHNAVSEEILLTKGIE